MAIIPGTSGDDKYPNELEGTEAADQIFGLAGDDALIGFGGDDELEGGKGADELFGSAGFDLASYRGSDTGVYFSLYGLEAKYGDAKGDHFYSVEGAIGSAFRDLFVGDDERNVFRGEGGDDQLGGLGGADTLDGGGGNDLLEGGAGDDELRGGAGVDTASFYNYAGGVVADLASGTATGGDFVGSDRLFGVENLGGTPYVDRLAGNSGANRLHGSFDGDTLVGRGGADRFVYWSGDSSSTAPDRILDFSRAQGDRIDLAGVDANERVDGDQAFRFVGQNPFTGVGQLRFFQQNGDTVVEANTTDLTGGSELRIVVDPLFTPQAGDFVL